MNVQPSLIFFCALPCEAKPLIHHYALKKMTKVSAFDLYHNEKICLTISGPGKINMAAALSYTLALFPVENPILINLGIAGCRNQPRGQLFLSDKVIDQSEPRQCFYPQWLGSKNYDFRPLMTVAAPTEEYDEQALFDMEASAFYPIAIKFSTVELIHCLKIVSDNAQHSTFQINAKQVADWVRQNIPKISAIVEELSDIQSIVQKPEHPQLDEILQRYHFSTTSQQQLHHALQRWQLLSGHSVIPLDRQNFKTGKQLLHWLNQQNLPFYL
jgi:nucleoside phosphorylase